MNLTLTQKLTDSAVSQLINEAREAESSRDLILHQEILNPIWNDIEVDPDFFEYNDLQKAELYRLSGYFISFYGKSKNIRHYQERAKDLLTISIELFFGLNEKDKAAEAKIILALCYFYEGAIVESETILQEVIADYSDDQLHLVYLKSCINLLVLLHWRSEFQMALNIIREIEIPVEFCRDNRLIYMFHTQAGMIYRGIQQYDLAITHYNQSIETAQEINNQVTVAVIHNNLAFLYKIQKNYEAAHNQIEIAIKIFRELKQQGWLAHILDTKALIYFAENKFDLALKTIDEVIDLLQNGEDYALLIDVMWNKVRCCLELHQVEQAILLFAELARLAQIHIGEVAVKKYTDSFTGIVYFKRDNSLEDEVRRFKKLEIISALRRKDYNFEETASVLGYSTTNKLIKVLNTEFPEIYDEIGIQPRTNQPKIKNLKDDESGQNDQLQYVELKLINELYLKNCQLEFSKAPNIPVNKIKTFYCSSEKMAELFNISYDVILAVAPFDPFNIDQPLLIRKDAGNEYSLARVSHDKIMNIYYLTDNNVPLTFDEVEIIGKAIGYCSFVEADNDKLFFEPLPK